MKKIPVYASSSFGWKGNHGSAKQSDLIEVGQVSVPKSWNGIAIQSKKTGKIALFDPVYDEDGYDGEFMVYSLVDKVFATIWNY